MSLSRLAALALAVQALACPCLSSANPLGNPENMVDLLLFWEGADAWRAGSFDDVGVILAQPARLVLHESNDRAFPREGRWTSPITETQIPFTEFLPSWNVDAPPETGVRFDVRVRDAETGDWSPWLHMGAWGRVSTSLRRTVRFDGGEVDVDVLTLSRPADAFEMRAEMQGFTLDTAVNPTIRRIAISYSGQVNDPARRAELNPPPDLEGADWARVIDVPHIGQGTLGRPLSALCCSPTSVTMVLNALGSERTLLENSMAIYDSDAEIFGNWGRAVAHAASLGNDAWLQRFRTWDQVKAMIAQGQPVIASVSIGEGELDGADYSGGHLMVVRGFTPNGDPVVNDPAYSGPRGDAAVYRADQYANVWFGHGGVGYIIRPMSE